MWINTPAVRHPKYAIALALLLACVAVVSVAAWPWVNTADGGLRLLYARDIAFGSEYGNHGPLIVSRLPILLYTSVLKIGGGPGVITTLQIVAVFSLLYFVIGAFRPAGPQLTAALLSTCFVLSPPVMMFTTASIDSVPALVGLTLLCIGVAGQSRRWLLIAAVGCFVAIGSRPNSLGAVVLICVLAPWVLGPNRWAKVAVLCASAALAFWLPSLLLKTEELSPIAVSMAWDLIALATLNPNEAHGVLDIVGPTDEAARLYNPRGLNAIFWGAAAPFPIREVAGAFASDIYAIYLDNWVDRPLAMLNVKLIQASYLLGIAEPNAHLGYGLHPSEQTMGSLLWTVWSSVRWISSIAQRPYITLAAAAFCALYWLRREPQSIEFLLLAAALGYFATFLVFSQSMEFRYFFPTFAIVWSVVLRTGLFDLPRRLRGLGYKAE